MKLHNYQKSIINENKSHTGIFLGCGTGKTLIALLMARGKTLVICPLQQKLDKTWEKNRDKFNIPLDLTVMSKETFRRDHKELSQFETVILDESHTMVGLYPDMRTIKGVRVPKSSQLFDSVRWFMKHSPPLRFYALSATPASKPMNAFAIGVLLGRVTMDSYYKFREIFYIERKIGYRSLWIAKKDTATKDRLIAFIKSMGYTGALSDFEEDFTIPEQTFVTKHFPLTSDQKHAIKSLDEADPMVRRTKQRSIENGILYGVNVVKNKDGSEKMTRGVKHFKSEKLDYILERTEEFPRMIIFANYTAQVEAIAKVLTDAGYNVSTLTGQTKNREGVIEKLQACESGILVAQSSISSGWELPTFPVVIFASFSWQYLHREQALGRVLRANHVKKNLYIDLVVEGKSVDNDCYKAICSGKDFQEKLMEN